MPTATPTAEKLDLYQLHKADYAAPKRPILVDIKPARYLCVTGQGRPDSDCFQKRIAALYGTAYTLKFLSKFAGNDYAVCKLEGIYWTDQGGPGFETLPMDQWHWNLIVRVPDFLSAKELKAAQAQVIGKGCAEASEVVFKRISEGKCVQMLHVGPYDRERETIELMCAFGTEQGYRFADTHHEIYLSDPRRCAPEKLKTILRIPVTKAK